MKARTVKVKGLERMTVKQARELQERIGFAIHALGPCPTPEMKGPAAKRLERLVKVAVAQVLTALSRGNMPANARCSHHGVHSEVPGAPGWTVNVSDHAKGGQGPGLFVNVHGPEYLTNIDGERVFNAIGEDLLRKVIGAAAKGFGGTVEDEWYGNCWVSCLFRREAPKNLVEAMSRYEAFESHPGYDAFDEWFQEGLRLQR